MATKKSSDSGYKEKTFGENITKMFNSKHQPGGQNEHNTSSMTSTLEVFYLTFRMST